MRSCEHFFAIVYGNEAVPVAALVAVALTLGTVEIRAQADFRADANLVVLQVTVADHQGRVVRNLSANAFHVYEDGVPQSVTFVRHEDTPVAVGLVIDNSGSMIRKLPEVVAATDAFARSSNPEDQMFIVKFNERVTFGLPPGEPFASDPDKLKASMMRIHANGKTALYDAIATAVDHIRTSSLQRKILIVLSDGGDNASTRRIAEILPIVQQSDVVIYTVGLFDEYNSDRNPGVLRQLAQTTGGEAFFPRELSQVTSALQAVSRDIRSQYTVAYVPTNGRRDGTYRKIRVTLTGSGSDRWIARTRTGYFAAPSSAGQNEPQKVRNQ